MRVILLLVAVTACTAGGLTGGSLGMGPEDFRWGKTSCEGLAVGIAVEDSSKGHPIAYRVAIANRSEASRRVTLFATLPGLYRVRVIGRQGTIEAVRPALYSGVRVTSNYSITETLASGQMIQRRGDPVDFSGRLSGPGVLRIVLSSLKADRVVPPDVREESDAWCHVESGEIPVEF